MLLPIRTTRFQINFSLTYKVNSNYVLPGGVGVFWFIIVNRYRNRNCMATTCTLTSIRHPSILVVCTFSSILCNGWGIPCCCSFVLTVSLISLSFTSFSSFTSAFINIRTSFSLHDEISGLTTQEIDAQCFEISNGVLIKAMSKIKPLL